MEHLKVAIDVLRQEPAFDAGYKAGNSWQGTPPNPYPESDRVNRDFWQIGYEEGCKVFNERQWQKWVKGK